MHTLSSRLTVALLFLASAHAAAAQTADDIVERSLKALGGRAAHEKLTSRSTLGTILLGSPAGEIPGTIEILNASPNKVRTLVKADLTSLGMGPLAIDQRFDGTVGYLLDSIQGNRDITGGQLENMRNNSFPHPFMTYKQVGTVVEVKGKEKVGERDAFLLIFTPKTGAPVRQYIDAETYLPTKVVLKVEIPQLGQEVEQSTEFSDYREVDGIKLPYRLKSTSSVQNFSVTVTHVQHNVPVDQALFSKPAAQ
jgi:hypothetical protein